jgi:hypothetical protein
MLAERLFDNYIDVIPMNGQQAGQQAGRQTGQKNSVTPHPYGGQHGWQQPHRAPASTIFRPFTGSGESLQGDEIG